MEEKPKKLKIGQVIIERVCYLDTNSKRSNLYNVRKRTDKGIISYDVVGFIPAKLLAKKIVGKQEIKVYTHWKNWNLFFIFLF